MQEAGPLPLRARPTGLSLAIAAATAVFAALAALVATGALTALDRYAAIHWMPGLEPEKATHVIPPLRGVIVPFSLDEAWWQKLLDVVTYPASVGISLLVFAVAGMVLVRRGHRTAALVWASAWFVANALEVAAKVAIEKPALNVSEGGTPYHLVPFDHSFPSGHTVRAVLVAAVVGYVWRRYAWQAAGWALVVPVCLVVTSAHVPSDVIGGLVFGLLVVLVIYAVLGSARVRGT